MYNYFFYCINNECPVRQHCATAQLHNYRGFSKFGFINIPYQFKKYKSHPEGWTLIKCDHFEEGSK